MLGRDIVPRFRETIVRQLTETATLARDRLPKLSFDLPLWQSPVEDTAQLLAPTAESSELFWESKGWAVQWDGYALFGDQNYETSNTDTQRESK
jgi:hypothetical protein